MPARSPLTPDYIKHVNVRYHDAAASEYDSKWGIDFGPTGQQQVRGKFGKALGEWRAEPFGDALEIGSGTGYFSLNLLQLGAIERLVATDISPEMLSTLSATAGRLGLAIETKVTDAETLPFEDESFDLVFGHAVLHHLPDLDGALSEFIRVLRPGGAIVFCGEPSRYGDLLAVLPKRGAQLAAPLWRLALGASARKPDAAENGDGHELEPEVDVHAFAPSLLDRTLADAGFKEVRIGGEELLANVYGWAVRTLEHTAEPDEVPYRWRELAFRGYIALQRVDTALLEPRLPPSIFYNLVLSARKSG
ncbi:MAG: class I SAM-dependent methyltransferase [Actinobacteria bacterium]|nr:MAG: class I SAM-dependent methyltransferase [Actinomycetota bacterium]